MFHLGIETPETAEPKAVDVPSGLFLPRKNPEKRSSHPKNCMTSKKRRKSELWTQKNDLTLDFIKCPNEDATIFVPWNKKLAPKQIRYSIPKQKGRYHLPSILKWTHFYFRGTTKIWGIQPLRRIRRDYSRPPRDQTMKWHDLSRVFAMHRTSTAMVPISMASSGVLSCQSSSWDVKEL